jgi:RND family efflux transporter MFP subunit
MDPMPRRSRAGLKLAGVAALVAALAVAVNGIWHREQNERQLAQWTDAQAIPTVAIVRPQPETKAEPLELPGDVDAWYEAPIYARVPGYLKMWYTDIGAVVKAGQVLAEIDTPDLDQQLDQAKHDLASAVANWKLAEVTAKRWKSLLSSGSVSQQSVDEKVADAAALKAKVGAAQANVDRLNALEGFKKLTAPFDGVVTARKTDIGALINVGSGTGPELFAVADIHKMRIYVRVPQSFSAQISVGMKATLRLPQYPNETFPAKVLTTASGINPKSRTLLVELEADNPDRKLWPGTFANVSFELPADPKVVQIPASALLFQQEGLQVAVLGPDDKVEIRSVRVGRNFGTTVEVLSGLSINDRVIDSPPDSIVAGQKVHPVEENAAIARDTGEAPAKSHQPGQERQPADTK